MVEVRREEDEEDVEDEDADWAVARVKPAAARKRLVSCMLCSREILCARVFDIRKDV